MSFNVVSPSLIDPTDVALVGFNLPSRPVVTSTDASSALGKISVPHVVPAGRSGAGGRDVALIEEPRPS